MRIRYRKTGVRELGEYRWGPENDHVVEVDQAEVAAGLLTYPRPQFEVAEDEPLLTLRGLGSGRVAELALAGVATLATLAALDEQGRKRVVCELRVRESLVEKWIDQARTHLGLENDAGGE